MEKNFDFSGQEVPEEIVDAFVDSIIVHKDYFEWNLKLGEEPVCCYVEGTSIKAKLSLLNNPTLVVRSTGRVE